MRARSELELRHGALAHEVLLVRVEALLALRRERDALQLLDGAPLHDGAAQRALLLTRGELRAMAGRCADAVADFDRVLTRSDARDPRALRGRAACTGR